MLFATAVLDLYAPHGTLLSSCESGGYQSDRATISIWEQPVHGSPQMQLASSACHHQQKFLAVQYYDQSHITSYSHT
jgi:hypothetical protein